MTERNQRVGRAVPALFSHALRSRKGGQSPPYAVCWIGAIALLIIAGGCRGGGGRVAWDSPGPSNPVANPGTVEWTDPAGAGAILSLYSRAVGVLELAAESEYPMLRANAIEAMHEAPELLPPYVRRGLADPNRGVRFVAAMTVGQFKLKDIAHLAEPLLLDPSESVQAAAIYALFVTGRHDDLNPLARMVRSDDPEVRGNAAMILGLLGNTSAIPVIEQSVGRGMELANPARAMIVDLQLAEALFKLGQRDQVHTIRAALFLPPEHQELTALACQMLGRIGDRGAIGGLQRLVFAEGVERRPLEVKIAALTALAQLGVLDDPRMLVQYTNHERPEIRTQAAYGLGYVNSPSAFGPLAGLIEDANPMVQVSAAAAIVRLERGRSP